MKFGARIRDAAYTEWQESYINYAGLKRLMKERQARHQWDDADEADFVKALEKELDKIVRFQENKIAELAKLIDQYEGEVKSLIATDEHRAEEEDIGFEDGASDTSEDNEDRFVELEEDLANVIADVHDLGHFTHLNYTGFVKIVKKHDKKTGFELRGQFMRDYLDKRPFYKENFDTLIVHLSRLYNLVRTRGHPVLGDSSAGGNQSAFVRQTTKYWVHPDNFVQLKLVLLKHLPVLVFDASKAFQPEDAAISSIYYDNEDLDLYLGRIEKTEGAEAIRLRWYGGMGSKTIFVERKTHREDWTGEKSVKARFPIQEELVNAYCEGRITMDETFEQLRKKGKKSDKEIDSMIKLAREVQHSILKKKLKPVMRTFYSRTAFQLPGDARVRVSFDTNLSLIREDNWDGRVRAGDNWRRTDIGIDFPFDQLPAEDKHIFPYGVLEVKLQTQLGQEPPEWVRELVSSHLVEAVPKFSKFIHGCATLMPNRVDLVPFWLPQMETDIRKPATSKAQIERPVQSASASASNTPSDTPSKEQPYTEPLSDDEEDDGDHFQSVTQDEAGWANLPPQAAAEAAAIRQRNAQQASEPEPSQAKRRGKTAPEVFTKLTRANLARLINTRYGRDEEQNENASNMTVRPGRLEYVSSYRAEPGKRIAIPVRIEPKVYFANERTMLGWLEFSVVVAAIGIGILNYGEPDDDVALAASACFTAVALLAILYTTGRFTWRVIKIRNREAVLYHDWLGPSLLCTVLLVSVIVNFTLRFREATA